MSYTYLALGDSYTIGEAVPTAENFPYQTAALLRKGYVEMADPMIIAQTGWTTDELAASIREHALQGQFSVVSLLIGVNNQYRERELEQYKEEFSNLLQQAIAFAGDIADHVFVVSIPDWGVTPFAEGRDRAAIATAIDNFNSAAKEIALDAGAQWLDITDSTRENGTDPEYLAEDGLHPSGPEYAIWAHRLAPMMKETLESEK
jgi:lysophospholipase L1-like esterase